MPATPQRTSTKSPSRDSAKTERKFRFMDTVRNATARRRRRSGQTALEYIIVFAVLLSASAATVYFMRASGRAARHDIDVICSDRY